MPLPTNVAISDVKPWLQYAGDDLATLFQFNFWVPDTASLAVYLDDVRLAENMDYTVARAVEPNVGGSVTMTTAPTSSQKLTLTRDIPVARLSDFPTGGALHAAVLNLDLDTLTAIARDLEYTLESRVLQHRITVGEPPSAPTLPVGEAGKHLRWADAYNLENVDPATGPTIATVDGGSVASPITPIQLRRDVTAAIAGFTPSSGEPVWDAVAKLLRIGDGVTAGGISVAGLMSDSFIDVTHPDFGATGNSLANDQPGIQAALDTVEAAGGGVVILPYVGEFYLLSDSLQVGSNTVLVFGGSYLKINPFDHVAGPYPFRGQVLGLRRQDTVSENIAVINALVDANNQPVNCIGMGSSLEMSAGGSGDDVHNVRVIGGHVKNALLDQDHGGGKGLTAQRGAENILFSNVVVENCATAAQIAPFFRDVSAGGTGVGDAPPTLEYARAIMFSGLVVRECGRLFLVEDVIDGGESGSDETTGHVVFQNVIARNVGDPRTNYTHRGMNGSSAPTDGEGAGVFAFDGGNRVMIDGVTIVNDPSYAKVGALFRGHFKYAKISNVYCESDAGMRAIFDHRKIDQSVSPLNPKFWPSIHNDVSDITVRGPIDYVIDAEPAAAGTLRCRYNTYLDIACEEPLVQFIAPDAIGTLNNRLRLSEHTTNKVLEGALDKFDDYGNSFASSTALYVLLGDEALFAGIRTSGTVDKALQPVNPAARMMFSYGGSAKFAVGSAGAELLSPMVVSKVGSVPAAIAEKVVLFAEDDGGGKVRLMARFPTGAVQQLAIEP